jgi:hypothetical protein
VSGFAPVPDQWICSICGCPPVPYMSICSSSWRVDLFQFKVSLFAPVPGGADLLLFQVSGFAPVLDKWICSICGCPPFPYVSICSSSWQVDLLPLQMTGFAPISGKLICSSSRWTYLLQFQMGRCPSVPYENVCSSSWRVDLLQFQASRCPPVPYVSICSSSWQVHGFAPAPDEPDLL